MALPRLHLFETTDLAWLPPALRRVVCRAIDALVVPVYAAAAPQLADLMARGGMQKILDVGAGHGGIWRVLRGCLDHRLHICLSDRYPPTMPANWPPYRAEPVDARDLPAMPDTLITLINVFHHLKPADAAHVLARAGEQRQPILVLECTRRSWFFLRALVQSWPHVMGVVRAGQPGLLGWGKGVIVSMCYIWDAMVSSMRTYTPQELAMMAEHGDAAEYPREYGFEIGTIGSGQIITYVLGHPDLRGVNVSACVPRSIHPR